MKKSKDDNKVQKEEDQKLGLLMNELQTGKNVSRNTIFKKLNGKKNS
jgi:hypothetical protein